MAFTAIAFIFFASPPSAVFPGVASVSGGFFGRRGRADDGGLCFG